MITLKAEKRNPEIKAKKLRRDGFATGVLFGKEMEDSISLQFSAKDATNFIKGNKAGAQVLLDIEGDKVSALVKNIDYDPLKKQILALDCQALVSGEKVSTTVQIHFLNEDMAQGIVEPALSEIHYKADPANLLDTVEIDFEKLAPEVKSMCVKDLKLNEGKEIDLITPEDALIFHIAQPAAEVDVPETEAAEDNAAGENKEA